MMTSYFNLMKYAQTGIASPDMAYYDKMRASTLMGGSTVQTLTGIPPLSFKADGTPLISWSMLGSGQQTVTPTPSAPITPDFVGTLDNSNWTIPIACDGQTTSVYLGQVQTVRAIRKVVFDGSEHWKFGSYPYMDNFMAYGHNYLRQKTNICICTHLQTSKNIQSGDSVVPDTCCFNIEGSGGIFYYKDTSISDLASFKSWLQQQYAAGTPVTLWYVLATPETAIVNEPLRKIGDYADELSSTDAGVAIPAAKGNNVLTIDTTLQPSEMTITFKG